MTVGIGQNGAIDGYEAIEASPGRPAASRPATAMFRRRSAQPSRRAVLHLRVNGAAPAPADLASWYTERAFHFYLAGLRLPARTGQLARRPDRTLGATFAELDATCAYLRDVDGMTTVIVAADGIGALAAALWCDARRSAGPADALILQNPDFGDKPRLSLDIACPVLVLGGAAAQAAAGRRRPGQRRQQAIGAIRLGSHVTWLSIPAQASHDQAGETDQQPAAGKAAGKTSGKQGASRPADGATASGEPADPDLSADEAAGDDRSKLFDEMGRWLGAYMYGSVRDQLL